MATIYQKAFRKNKKAMTKLYEANKEKVYFLCSHLLDSEKSTQEAFVKIFENLWRKLDEKNCKTDEDFNVLLITLATKYCKKKLLSENPQAFKAPTQKHHISEKEARVDENDTKNNIIINIIDNLTPRQKYIFLIKSAFKLTTEQSAAAFKTGTEIAKDIWMQAENVVKHHLTILKNNGSKNAPEYSEIYELLNQSISDITIPENIDTKVRNYIADISIRHLPTKKVMIPIICVLVFAIGVVSYIIISKSVSDNETDTKLTASSEGTASNTAEESTASTELSAASASSASSSETEELHHAQIEIKDYGTITVELNATAAPKTVENFISLANDGFYNGLTFHRIIDGFMMQGGDPNGDGTGGSTETITGEFTDNGFENNLSHTRGAISMARSTDYDSASSQFFIVHEDSTYLDGQYAVFGYVTDGMDIVDKICSEAEPTDGNGTIPSDQQPIISSITILD